MDDVPVGNNGPARAQLAYLYNFVCDCPDPVIRTTIEALVDHWLSNPESLPGIDSLKQLEIVLNQEEQLQVSWLLAMNPNTPASVLQDLCKDAHPHLLERIAENTRTSSSTLSDLACQGFAEVRIAAAGNANTPLACIMILIEDSDVDVRYSLAENHHLNKTALDALADDANAFVKFRAEKTISRLNHPSH